MIDKIKEKMLKYKEIINYLIFGLLTTIVNFTIYFIFANFFKLDELVSNCIAWFISILFAYITNKLIVFESKPKKKTIILKQITLFVASRLLSGLICDIIIFGFMIKVLKINDIIVKVITQIIVIVLNYLSSKLVIFKKIN
ncbi:MAG: GtrA family protein [Clostridia bacterium]